MDKKDDLFIGFFVLFSTLLSSCNIETVSYQKYFYDSTANFEKAQLEDGTAIDGNQYILTSISSSYFHFSFNGSVTYEISLISTKKITFQGTYYSDANFFYFDASGSETEVFQKQYGRLIFPLATESEDTVLLFFYLG